jgi:eukaryotic-like serine/threonine-protein kinase
MATEIVGRYELLRPLGAGGMGEVFLARDQTLRRQVAIKRVQAGDEKAAKSILHEARVVASLEHPNIASVYDVVEHDGQAHIVMEFVDGMTLSQRMAAGTLTEAQAVDYGRQIASALAYAHTRNVLHCDIKPGNVMISADGVPKVLDFGIARRDSHSSADATTTTNLIQGTPPYMAPEVLLGSRPSQQSDVFGLGVMLYELVAGRRPYEGRGPSALLTAMTAPPPALDTAVAGVSREFSAIVQRAIHIDRQQRVQSAAELKAALDRIAPGTTRTSERPLPQAVGRSAAAKSAALLVGLAVVCAALVAGIPRFATGLMPKQSSVLGVVMFNNTGDADNEYLAAGMADVLVSQLADAPGITIVPRSATATLTQESQIGEAVKALGLTHVIAGSVQRSGKSLRMAISLLADKGATVKWSRSFDGPIDDVFHLEQRIGQATLEALRSQQLITSATVLESRDDRPTMNADAFDNYAHGRALIERFDVPGNIDRALMFFARAVALDPGFARAHAAIGDALWRKYRATRDTAWIDRARAAMLSAIRLAPYDVEVGYTMAIIDQGTGRNDDAVAALEKVLAQQPAYDDAHRLLARIYSSRGDFDQAIGELREAQAIRPDYPPTVRELGLAYYDKGKFQEAIASFTRLTTLQPDNASAYQTLGTALHAANEFDRALVAYRQANAITPRPTAFSNIGTIHYSRAEYPQAVDAYRSAIALQPKEATTHRNLADALWMAGDQPAAVVEYERAIELANDALAVNPKAARYPALVAYCHAKIGRIATARQLVARIVSESPDDSDAIYKQGVIEALAGNRARAITLVRQALSMGYSQALVESDHDLDSLRSLPEFARLREVRR